MSAAMCTRRTISGVVRMKSIEWWRSTAQHMWRTFFALKRKFDDAGTNVVPIVFNMKNMSDSDRKIYDICNRIFTDEFVKTDQDILQMYFTSRWGDDLYAVEDYSLKHNVPTRVIWIVIRRANRLVMEEIGLLDRKESADSNADT